MELLKKLTECGAPSGNEESIRNTIKEYAEGFADEVSTDALGNLIVHKKGNGTKIMLAAHMDEIGVIVTFIEKDGFIRFAAVGGLYVKELAARRVCFSNGTIGIIGVEEESSEKTISHMFIDIGARSLEEAETMIKIGDTACFLGETQVQNGRVISKALDNRIGCYVLLKILEQCTKGINDLYFVFTVQEEVGLRGAKTAGFGILPDIAVAVDVTDTGDMPKSSVMAVKLGGGAAVKVMDSSCMCHPFVRGLLVELAKGSGIPYQMEVLTVGGTDAGAIHLTADGVRTGGISVPARFIHSPSEMVDISDVQACIRLGVSLCENMINLDKAEDF